MKPYLLSFGLLLAWPKAGHAQTPAPAALPSPSASFFRKDFSPSNSKDSTAYCAETTYRDSVSGVTRVYFPSGRLKQFVPFANIQEHILYGTLTTWYENGVMCTKEDYVAGKRHGELLTYYPDGTLKRRDQYVNGSCGVGSCYGPNGAQVPYFAYEQLPLYPGGNGALIKELAQGVRLDAKEKVAMRHESERLQKWGPQPGLKPDAAGWKRQVDVELAVGDDGRITNARVVRSNTPFLNGAALRAVATLKRQFVPARRDGQVVAAHFTVPVYYTLDSPSSPLQLYKPPTTFQRKSDLE